MQYTAELADAAVVLVGCGGLGLACAEAFVGHGSRVGIIDADADRLDTAVSTLGAAIGIEKCDVTQQQPASEAITAMAQRLGGLDVLVHAVGINQRRPFLDVTGQSWTHEMDVNLASAMWCGQAAARLMSRQRSGRIVYFSSVSAYLGHPKHSVYAASKGGLNQLIKVMAIELASAGVRVNGVAPGYTETALTKEYLDSDGMREKLEKLVPVGRLGTPEDVVGPVLFLSTQQSAYVTGQVLLVDGGRTLD